MGECNLIFPHRYQCCLLILIVLLAGTALSACGSQQPAPAPTDIQEDNPTPRPTSTASPSLTPTPEQPLVILLAAPDADANLVGALQTQLTELADQEGLGFELRQELTPSELGEAVRLVVVPAPDPGLAALVAAAPQVQFLAVDISGIEPAGNLSSVSAGGITPDQLAFAAGYMAATVTDDWRVGVISEAGTAAGEAAELGFTNGVFFLCGLCRPVNPPFPIPGYPLVAQVSPGGGEADWQSAISYFQEWQVGTVYVAPEVADPGLLGALAEAGINIIGTQAPPADVKPSWVATLGYADLMPAIDTLLPSILDGQGSQQIQLPVTIQNVNEALLSPGRQRLVEEMLVDLMAGYIDTGVNPESGESSLGEVG
jgi:hypothetical protein